MAQIVGVTPGLKAGSFAAAQKVRAARKPREPKLGGWTCSACGAVGDRFTSGGRSSRVLAFDNGRDGVTCMYCERFFGGDNLMLAGETNVDHDLAKKRVQGIRDGQLAMVLRTNSFAAGETTFTVDAGDIFRARALEQGSGDGASKERTRSMFMVEAMVGPFPLLLYPHEFAPIPWLAVMEMRRAGEVSEEFVAAEDADGYFKPSPEMRELIDESFGNLINAPRRK